MSLRCWRVMALGFVLLCSVGSCDSGSTGPTAVASVTVAPSTASVAPGGTQQYTATVKDATGNALTGRAVTWSSSNAIVATVSNSGLATGMGDGAAAITATSEGKTGTASVTVSGPVASVTVAPDSATIFTWSTQSFAATLMDAGGYPLTRHTVTWTTSNAGVATIVNVLNPYTGLAIGVATGVAAGTTTITATSEGKTGSATLTVAAPFACAQIDCGLGLDQFSLIPSGSFQMGSTIQYDEQPVHTVNITHSFYMQKTEVTQGQWRAVMGTNPSYFTSCGDTCPVEDVSWDHIQRFIHTLNARAPGVTYRLPTEAEWEYAARAGATGEIYAYYGGLDPIAWYSGNAGMKTHAVGGKQPNAWGLYDVLGNVSEWVQDWYGSYSTGTVNDPTGPATGSYRVTRGGSWYYFFGDPRLSFRGSLDFPALGESDLGFRLVRTP